MTTDAAADAGVSRSSALTRHGMLVDRFLAGIWRHLPVSDNLRGLVEAIEYSALAPGKRVRPALLLAAAESCGTDPERVIDIAAAVELVHAYSLVHDDLPSMDDDDLRRGMPTSHRMFGEGVAILVGDALQAEAYRLIAGSRFGTAAQRLEAVALLARASGWAGMVGGQYIDIDATRALDDVEALKELHGLKTGALLRASVEIGAVLGGATGEARERYAAFGTELGWLFQLVDDLLDEVGDADVTGKTAGSDRRQEKVTAVDVLGLDGLRAAADDQLGRCLRLAAGLPGGGGSLPQIARYVHSRDR